MATKRISPPVGQTIGLKPYIGPASTKIAKVYQVSGWPDFKCSEIYFLVELKDMIF
jgi:hypothetical protein